MLSQFWRPEIQNQDHWVGKMAWRTARQPTSVFLPRESLGQQNLAGYSPRGRKELDTTEQHNTAQGWN